MTDERLLVINRHRLSWLAARMEPVGPDTERILLTRVYGGGLDGWEGDAFLATYVAEMSDSEHILRVARWAIRNHQPSRIVALHEKDLLVAAQLREEFSIAGPSVADVLPYRDKYVMKQKAQDANIPVPRFALASEKSYPWGGPTVTKDRWGLGASSIRYWPNPQAAIAGVSHSEKDLSNVLLEERIDGDMYECNSLVMKGQTVFSMVGRYLQALGEFESLDWHGSITPVSPADESLVLDLNERTLDALGRHDTVTHGEYFRTTDGNFLLCEVAARPGGGGTDAFVRHAIGVDIIAVALAVAEGREPRFEMVRSEDSHVLLGLYPTDGGDSAPLGDGVVHHESLSVAGPGKTRHALDFHDLYVLGAADEEQAMELLRSTVIASGRRFE